MQSRPSWIASLRAPAPSDHLVQFYDDIDFLARAAACFVGSGLVNGEGVVIIAISAHVDAIARQLALEGLDVSRAVNRGQLVIRDAHRGLDELMANGRPDRASVLTLATDMLDGVRNAGFGKIRLYGEMVNLLWDHNLDATIELEELWNKVAREQDVAVLCPYGIDNFDHHAHRRVLHRIARAHSRLIPVEDDERLEHAVARAYADVFGKHGEAEALRDILIAQYPSIPAMPRAQAALFALCEVRQDIADAVIERAGQYYRSR